MFNQPGELGSLRPAIARVLPNGDVMDVGNVLTEFKSKATPPLYPVWSYDGNETPSSVSPRSALSIYSESPIDGFTIVGHATPQTAIIEIDISRDLVYRQMFVNAKAIVSPSAYPDNPVAQWASPPKLVYRAAFFLNNIQVYFEDFFYDYGGVTPEFIGNGGKWRVYDINDGSLVSRHNAIGLRRQANQIIYDPSDTGPISLLIRSLPVNISADKFRMFIMQSWVQPAMYPGDLVPGNASVPYGLTQEGHLDGSVDVSLWGGVRSSNRPLN